ncbi:hypothetical protein ACVW04_000593 [Bradyrhizobium sp. LM2.3]
MGELEPGAGEGVGELIGILQEAPRDFLIGGIETQREIGGQHGRPMLLGLVESVRNDRLRALGRPLLRTRRALRQFPFVLEQVLEEVVAPLRRRRRPCHLETAGDGITADARSVLALPAEALILERARFRLRSDQRRIASTMGLAEGMATGDQRDGFLVIHRHAEEGLADVLGRGDRIRLAVRAFRIDVDEAHLHRAERLGELAFAAVALIAQPGAFGAPIELLRLPHVGAATGEAEGLEAHRFQRDVAGQHHQIGPGNLAAVLLLDRPEQTARLVEVGVVGPAVERRETLLTGAGATAAVRGAVGARAVPGHADHETAIVTEVGGPPFLRFRHQSGQILDDRVQVERLEFLGVVEFLAHRIGQAGILVQHLDAELSWPPIAVRWHAFSTRKRALRIVVHEYLLWWRRTRALDQVVTL